VRAALDALGGAAGAEHVNLMPLLVECAKAYCTVGEICGVLREEFGTYDAQRRPQPGAEGTR
jgi:methylmalonyl-CoA mutase N-terminal domain/subunit